MPKSDAPRKKMKKSNVTQLPLSPQDRYAATSWGAEGSNIHDLTVPSGQLVQVRFVGPTALISMGLLENVDLLGHIVQADHVDRVAGKAPSKEEAEETRQRQMQEMLADPSKLVGAVSMIDKIITHVVLQPKVHKIPEAGDDPANPSVVPDRVKGLIYVDSVDEMDKMYIFNYVMGGVKDLESFREGIAETMADLVPVETVSDDPQPTPKRKRSPRKLPPE
jgi:hypothetical protein